MKIKNTLILIIS
jgi:hypothetical protein